jgi:hypothetical protein
MTERKISRDPADWDRTLIEQQLAEHQRSVREPDPFGKSALFSASAPRAGGGRLGTLTLECSSCRRESPVKLRDIPRLAFPVSIHLPRRYHSYMKCPSCGRRAWLRAHVRL